MNFVPFDWNTINFNSFELVSLGNVESENAIHCKFKLVPHRVHPEVLINHSDVS